MDKEKSTEKIDVAVATVMALDLFFEKENLSGRWRGLKDHGCVYVSE